jgi:hypothetical protein
MNIVALYNDKNLKGEDILPLSNCMPANSAILSANGPQTKTLLVKKLWDY